MDHRECRDFPLTEIINCRGYGKKTISEKTYFHFDAPALTPTIKGKS